MNVPPDPVGADLRAAEQIIDRCYQTNALLTSPRGTSAAVPLTKAYVIGSGVPPPPKCLQELGGFESCFEDASGDDGKL